MHAETNQPPICHDRPMEAVMSYRTSNNAYDRTQDTPVYWCPDCGRKVRREVAQ